MFMQTPVITLERVGLKVCYNSPHGYTPVEGLFVSFRKLMYYFNIGLIMVAQGGFNAY